MTVTTAMSCGLTAGGTLVFVYESASEDGVRIGQY